MIPIRLQIQGFLSYHEKVDLDFRDFDLACISGSNGAGKSSLLDAITWVLFGEARRKDDTVINHQSTGAEVIFDFSYEDIIYRVQRSKKKDESTKLEFFIQTDEGMLETTNRSHFACHRRTHPPVAAVGLRDVHQCLILPAG